jgi:hypothetical protein
MLKKGDKVVMHTCGEAEHYEGQIWNVTSNEWELCGSKVVMLKGFSGAFSCEYLQKIDLLGIHTFVNEAKENIQLALETTRIDDHDEALEVAIDCLNCVLMEIEE